MVARSRVAIFMSPAQNKVLPFYIWGPRSRERIFGWSDFFENDFLHWCRFYALVFNAGYNDFSDSIYMGNNMHYNELRGSLWIARKRQSRFSKRFCNANFKAHRVLFDIYCIFFDHELSPLICGKDFLQLLIMHFQLSASAMLMFFIL